MGAEEHLLESFEASVGCDEVLLPEFVFGAEERFAFHLFAYLYQEEGEEPSKPMAVDKLDPIVELVRRGEVRFLNRVFGSCYLFACGFVGG